MKKENLSKGLFIDMKISRTIEKINMLEVEGRNVVIKLQDKSATIVAAFHPAEDEKEVFENIRLIYLEHLKKKLQNLNEEFENL